MKHQFQLAACADMLWLEKPTDWRVARLTEMGFGVGLWNWPDHNLSRLESIGANFTIMNGYLEGSLVDNDGAQTLLRSAHETAQIGKRLNVAKLNLHGTGLGADGIPVRKHEIVTGQMWLKARDTLNRLCDMAEKEEVVFTLENLNHLDHPGCPFGSPVDVLSLVSSVGRPELRINLDLYHAQISGGDLVRLCQRCLPWIGEIQIADNPGRCQPGTGEINYPFIAQSLIQMGYSGTVGMEAFAEGDDEVALLAFRDAFTI